MNARVTMAAVAKRAGVHVTTVSLALRNHPSLPMSTRERLRTLAERMGYAPDPALCSLVAYRNSLKAPTSRLTLAYVTNWNTRWGWKDARAHARFYSGASDRSAQLGYQLEHFWLGESDVTPQRLSQILSSRGITGVIVASHGRKDERSLDFNWPQFSAVKIDFLPHEPAMHNVTNDQRAIIRLGMRQAIAAGYRRIGFVMSEWWDRCVDSAWSAGFLAEAQTLPRSDRVPMLVVPDSDGSSHVPRVPFERWRAQHRPEVLISNGSYVLPRLAEMKLSVPGDIAFIDLFLDPTDNRIAGVRQNCHRVGELAVEILVGQLHQHTFGLPQFPTSTLVEGTWFDGASLPPRVPPAAVRRPGRVSSSVRVK